MKWWPVTTHYSHLSNLPGIMIEWFYQIGRKWLTTETLFLFHKTARNNSKTPTEKQGLLKQLIQIKNILVGRSNYIMTSTTNKSFYCQLLKSWAELINSTQNKNLLYYKTCTVDGFILIFTNKINYCSTASTTWKTS